MRSSVMSSPRSVPTTAPSRSTSTRSAPSTTSSSSEEMSRTPRPCAASSSMSAWISALAPTSMPRVGSSRMQHLGVQAEHPGQQHLLLVAAGQLAYPLVRAGDLDPQPADEGVHERVLASLARRTRRWSAAAARPARCCRGPTGRRRRPSALRSSGTMPTPRADGGGRRPAPLGTPVHADRSVVDGLARRTPPSPSPCGPIPAARPGRRPRRRARRRLTSSSSGRRVSPSASQHRRRR